MRHNGCMSFPLGSLLNSKDGAATSAANAPADKVYKRQAKRSVTTPPPRISPLRSPLWLLVGALLWCLAVLAMLTHDPADAAFSISGSRELTQNRVGAVGAWASDLLLFCFGYSAWWSPWSACGDGWRVWPGCCEESPRHPQRAGDRSRWGAWACCCWCPPAAHSNGRGFICGSPICPVTPAVCWATALGHSV